MSLRAAFAALTVLLAGCGGGDSAPQPSVPEPDPLTKAQFLDEADRICFGAESQIEASADGFATQKHPDPAEVRRVVLRIVVPKLRTEANTIALLDPPPQDVDEVNAILTATQRGAKELERHPLSVLDGIPPSLKEAERRARAYGSAECGLR